MNPRERQLRREIYQSNLMKDKQALRHIHMNLKRLYAEISDIKTQEVSYKSPGVETLMNRLSSNQRTTSYGTI